MNKLLVVFSDSLIIGYILIPSLFFSYLFLNHLDVTYFIMPFILFYSLSKSGVFLLRGLGIVNNFFRIILIGMFSALLGSFLMILNRCFLNYYFLYDICAILIGLGLSCYPATYLTIKDILIKQNKWPLNNSLLLALPLDFIFILCSRLLIKNYYNYFLIIFFIYLIVILISLFKLKTIFKIEGSQATFIKNTQEYINTLVFILVFLLSLLTRFIMQSPKNFIIPIIITIIIIIIFSLHYKKRKPKYFLPTLWFGGIQSYLIIYTIIFFTVIGNYQMINFAYLLFVAAILLAVSFNIVFNPNIKVKTCIMLIILSSFFILFKKTYLIGLFIVTFLGTIGSIQTQKYYLNDFKIITNEKRFMRYRFLNIGSIVMQALIIILLIILSSVFKYNRLIILINYALHHSDNSLSHIIYISIIINWILIIISGIILLKISKDYNYHNGLHKH